MSVFSPDSICGITPIELMLEINDFVRLQCVNGAGILDETDDDAVADFGLHELQDLRHAVGKLRRGLARGGRLCAGILRNDVSRRERKRGDGGDGQKRTLKVLRFHNQHLKIEHPNIARVARAVNSGRKAVFKHFPGGGDNQK